MIIGIGNYLFLLVFILHADTFDVIPYDYRATIDCLAEPLKPQYNGGIITNPEFNNGLKGWLKFGNGKIERRISKEGNHFVVVHTRKNANDSFSQKHYMQKGNFYTFSGWIQVSKGKEAVTAIIKTSRSHTALGTIIAKSGCWSMLKGGITIDSSGVVELYFQSENADVEIWLDNMSLQPFTKDQWRDHQNKSIAKIRKKKVKIQLLNNQGKILAGAKISIKQNKPSFPFGSVMNKPILDNTAYQKWFTSRFTVTTFGNEMKWYSHEISPGKEDYSISDAMVNFAKQNGIDVRGHNIFWDDEKRQPSWIKSLTTEQLIAATEKRIRSVVSRYAGKLIAWDVVNENLHYSFFEDKLGKNFSSHAFQYAHQIDSGVTLFQNEYNTIEESRDDKTTPTMYLQKLREIQSFQEKTTKLGIGLQGHFQTPNVNIPYMRSAIDTLATAGLPIWITELDVMNSPNQVRYLEEILREAHSHPAIKGIILWTATYPDECENMCLTDNNFKNLPTGDVVDKLIHEWTQRDLEGITDNDGVFKTLLFYGDYTMKINYPTRNSSSAQSFKVEPKELSHEKTLNIQIKE